MLTYGMALGFTLAHKYREMFCVHIKTCVMRVACLIKSWGITSLETCWVMSDVNMGSSRHLMAFPG